MKRREYEDHPHLDTLVSKLEGERGIGAGKIVFDLMIESPKGTLSLLEIAQASVRIQSLTLGPEDYCRELGVEPSADGVELQFPLSQIVTICKAKRLKPMGLMGSIGDFRDLTKFKRSASRAAQLGCEGASCIHPDQVKILNEVFSFNPTKVDHARSVIQAFEEGARKGSASVNVNGQMVDIPVYQRAKILLDQNQAIQDIEQKKVQALRQLE